MMLGLYELGLYKSEVPTSGHGFTRGAASLLIRVPEELLDNCTVAVERAVALAETQMQVMDLVNAPSNKLVPRDLEDWAIASGKMYGYKVTTFDPKAMEALGLHALLAVNRGSVNPPVFLVMEYKPQITTPGQVLPTVGLVGKGVTFDTGGISIKPSANMHFMKSDMAGAGAVLGAMEAAAKLQLPIHLVGVVPATENNVDAKAINPGDVIGSYAGKTIEVIDTDAEGRLILADGLAYCNSNYQPDYLIDLATLTGSAVQTFGYTCAALFSTSEALTQQLRQTGDACGERVWPLPLWEAYASDIKSDVADLKNYHGKPVAGAIVAAKFLEVFTAGHSRWAHLDMAGLGIADGEFSSMRSATAWGVRLITDFLRKLEGQ
jgi:leucyl aminopeptidase